MKPCNWKIYCNDVNFDNRGFDINLHYFVNYVHLLETMFMKLFGIPNQYLLICVY